MAFNLEAFLGGVAEHGIDYMREEKEEQRRKQRAEDDFGITKRGIDYRLDAQDKLTKREKRKGRKEKAPAALVGRARGSYNHRVALGPRLLSSRPTSN